MNNISNVSTEIISNYQGDIEGKHSPATTKRKLSSLKRFFDWAHKEGHVEKNPIPAFPEVKGMERKPKKVQEPVANAVTPSQTKSPRKKIPNIFKFGMLASMAVLIFLLLSNVQLPIPWKDAPASTDTSQVVNTKTQTGDAVTQATVPLAPWNVYAKLNLKDADGNPIVGSSDATFKIYFDEDDSSSNLYTKSQSVTTNEDGDAFIILEETPTDMFFENEALFLATEIDGEEVGVRLPISTANQAANIGGYYPGSPTIGSGPVTVPVLSEDGSLLLASEAPAVKATEGGLMLEGQTVLISTPNASDGDIEINPDGSGIAHFLFEGTGQNFLNAEAPNLTSGSLFSGSVANNAVGYDLIRLQSGSNPTTKFSVDALGNTDIAGELSVIGDFLTGGTTRLSSAGALSNIAGYSQSSGNFVITQDAGETATITKSERALSDLLTLAIDERGKGNSSYSTLTLKRYDGAAEAAALYVDEGSAIFDGQLRLGRFSSNPGTIGTGAIFYNTTDNKIYYWNGTAWTDLTASPTMAFSAITSGTNTSAAMVVGTGASLDYSGTGTINAKTLNSLAETSFLRSDASDSFTSGTLTIDAGTTLDVNGDLSVADTNITLDGATTTFTSTGDVTINSGGGQLFLADEDTLNIGGLVDVAYNAFANSGEAPEEGDVSSDNDLYIGGDLEVDGTIYGTISGSASSLAWDDLSAPDANLAISMAEYTTDFNWNTAASSAAFDGLTLNLTNDAGTDGGNQRLLVLENADDAGATGTTENLLVLDNLDANEVVTTALSIADSGGGGYTTDISLQNGETIDNATDNQLNLNLGASGTLLLTSSTASTISNSAGNLNLTPTGNLVLNSTGGTIDIDDGTLDLSTQAVGVTLNNIADALNFDSDTLSIDAANNRVGIGTASPSYSLEVAGHILASGASSIIAGDSDGNKGTLILRGDGTSSNAGGYAQFFTAADHDTTYDYYHMNIYQDDLYIGRAGYNDITLFSDGNVGIGTITPLYPLQIGDGTDVDKGILVHTGGVTGLTASLFFKSTNITADQYAKGAVIWEDAGLSSARGKLHLAVDTQDDTGNAGVADAKLTIDSTGYVGIGTSSPNTPLEVTSTAPDISQGNVVRISGSLSSTTNSQQGLRTTPTISPGSASSLHYSAGLFGPSTTSTNLASAYLSGINSYVYYGSTGNISQVNGVNVIHQHVGSGTINNMRGYLTEDPVNSGGGTITNLAGVVVNNLTEGTYNTNLLLGTGTNPSNNYSIYNSSAYDNYLAGDVGIGIASPSYPLHVADTDTYNPIIKVESLTTGTAKPAIIQLENSNDQAWNLVSGTSNQFRIDGDNADVFTLYDAAPQYSFAIDAAGEVGIGDYTPDSPLEILSTTDPQLRISYTDGSVDTTLGVGSGGDLEINPTGGQVKFADVDTLNVGGLVDATYNAFANASDTKDEADIADDNDLYIGGDLEVDGSIYGAIAGGSVAWDDITAPDANLGFSMGIYSTDFTWDFNTEADDYWTMAFDNNGGTAGTDRLVTISNAVSDASSGDLNTEVMLLLDQADTTASGTTIVDDALLITNSGGSTLTDAIQVGTGSQAIGTGLNFGSTGITTDISFSNGETLINSTDTELTFGDGSTNLTIDMDEDTGTTVDFTTDNSSDLTFNPAGNVGIGTTTPTTQLHIGANAETHTLDTDDVLISSDLEVDGTIYADGGIIANSGGTDAIALSATPIETSNALSASSWLVENTANVGMAALMVNQTKSGDIFSASASGSPKMTLSNAGELGIGTVSPNSPLHISGSISDQYGMYLDTTLTGTTQNFGARFIPTQTSIATSGFYGVDARPTFAATSGGPQLAMYGTLGIPQIATTASANVATVMAGYFRVDNLSSSGSTITDARGVSIGNPTSTGTVTNSYGLHIADQTAGSTLNYSIYSLGGTNYFEDNVGIGTNDPDQKLHIYDGNAVIEKSATNLSLYLDTYSSTLDTHRSIIGFRKSGNGTIGSHTATATGEYFGQLTFNGSNGTGFVDGAIIRAVQDGSAGASYVPTAIDFRVSNGSSGVASALWIDPTGNIGIGDTTPDAELEVEVSDTGTSVGNLLLTQASTGDISTQYSIASSTNWSTGIDNSDSDKFKISASNALATSTIATFTTGGYLGMGNTSPVDPLEVKSTETGGFIARFDNTGTGSTDSVLKLKVGISGAGINNEFVQFRDATGSIDTIEGDGAGKTRYTGNALGTYSDRRLKENIIDYNDDAMAFLQNLRPVTFNYKAGTNPTLTRVGFVAQELMPYFPQAINFGDDLSMYSEEDLPTLGLDYGQLTPILVAAIRQQQGEIENLESAIGTVSLNSIGDIETKHDTTTDEYVVVDTSDNSIVSNISAFSDSVIGNLKVGLLRVGEVIVDGSLEVSETIKAGAVETSEITTNGITALTAQVDNLLVSSGLVTPQVETSLISPLADGNIEIQLGSEESTESGKLAITDRNEQIVASIDEAGNATFSGELKAEEVKTTKVYADDVIIDNQSILENQLSDVTLEKIETLLTEAESSQALLASSESWDTSVATESAELTEVVNTKNLYVTEIAAVNSLSLSESLTVGVDMVIDSATNSINTLSSPLSIQSLALAPVEIMAGLVTIDTSGNVNIAGNLYVAGNVESTGLNIKDAEGVGVAQINASGSASFDSLALDKLIIASGEEEVTTTVDGDVSNTNATAGKATILAGAEEILVYNSNVTDYSLIYLTPVSSTQNKVLFVKKKESCSESETNCIPHFVAGFNNPADEPVEFNWWIVDVK